MRILIISYYFPPYMNVGGLRPLSWARYFHDKGHEVTVIHGDGQEADSCSYFPASIDREIRTIQVHNPRLSPPGTQEAGGVPVGVAKRKALRRIKDRIKGYIPIIDLYGSWARAARRAARQEIMRLGGIDVLVSSSFPLSTHVVARRLKKETGALWVADFRDFFGQFDSTALGTGLPRTRRIRRFIQGIGCEANIVTTVSSKLAEMLSATMGARPIEVVFNGYFREHLPAFENVIPVWRILYTGSYNAREFTLAPLVDAYGILKAEGFNVPSIIFVGGYIESVDRILSEAGIDHEFLPAMNNREVLQLQRDSALLLLCDAMSGPGALLTKTFEYLAVRRPILVLARPGVDLEKTIFAKPSKAYLLSLEPRKIAEFIQAQAGDRRDADLGYYDAVTIESFSRESQAARLLDRIEKARERTDA